MANGNGSVTDVPSVNVVSSEEELRRQGQQNDKSFLTFVNPLPTNPESFRTGQTEKLKGLVDQLATARVDAAKEREEIRRRAAQDANARLLSTLGAQGLTQAITGVNTGASQRSQQAQQTLQQAQEARREAETQAEKVEETAPVQADIKGTQMEQQAQQQAQEQAMQAKKANMEQVQQSIDRINQVRANAVDRQTQFELMKREQENKKELMGMRFDHQMGLARARNQDTLGLENMKEKRSALRTFGGVVGTLKSALDTAYDIVDPETGEFKVDQQTAQTKLNGMSDTMSQLINESDQLKQAENKMRSAGVWSTLPQEQKEKIRTVESIAQSFAGVGRDAPASTYANIMEDLSESYGRIQDWEPTSEVTVGAIVDNALTGGGDTDTDGGEGSGRGGRTPKEAFELLDNP